MKKHRLWQETCWHVEVKPQRLVKQMRRHNWLENKIYENCSLHTTGPLTKLHFRRINKFNYHQIKKNYQPNCQHVRGMENNRIPKQIVA
jgi:hypothetical protein